MNPKPGRVQKRVRDKVVPTRDADVRKYGNVEKRTLDSMLAQWAVEALLADRRETVSLDDGRP